MVSSRFNKGYGEKTYNFSKKHWKSLRYL